MTLKFKVDTARRTADAIGKFFLAIHLAPKGNYLLTTTGHKSGILYLNSCQQEMTFNNHLIIR